MTAQTQAAEGFAAALRQRKWDGGVRIIVQGSMHALVGNASVDLEAGWRADVFAENKQRKPSFVLVADTPEHLFKDLAALTLDEGASNATPT